MALGHVKWWDDNGGYGFITLRESVTMKLSQGDITLPDGHDVFVHHSAIQSGYSYQTIEEGQDVELEVTIGPKGPIAANVREPEIAIDTDRPTPPLSTTCVKIFQEDSIRQLEYQINEYIRISLTLLDVNWRITSASMTNPDKNGKVSAIVVFDRQ